MRKKKVTVDLIDKPEFERLVHLGLSEQELYQFFECSDGALMQWIKLAYDTKNPLVRLKKLQVEGKIDFMIKQRRLAEKNPTLSIWVGKNLYEQTDDVTKESDGNDYEDLSCLLDLLKEDPKEEEELTNEPNSNN